MSWSFPLGRLFGSQLRVHATFFLLLIWIGAAAWADKGPAAALENVLFILVLFACVVAHEFGHALTARRYGIKTPDITLLPIGGMARLERMPEDPGQEIIVALAGPAVNVVIWAVLALVLGYQGGISELLQMENTTSGFLARLAAVNLFLAVFNMIPAFPMDGGRVFRAVLALFMPRERATRVAAGAGQVVAFGFGYLGLTSGNPILLLIAVFIFMAAAAESNDVSLHAVARNLLARDAMITQFESLSSSDSMQAAAAAVIRTTQHEFPVLTADGHLQGFLTRQAIFAALHNEHAMQPVSDHMLNDVPVRALNDPLESVLNALYQQGAPAVAITAPEGHMIGYITRENIGELFAIRAKR
ncbi:SREBP protease [Actibacterium atlanticum]|uniref:Zinc metalloprotease n=1 Tax=Actibacterium atlanticum TaxID=1461693 RepID=A0A058ZQV1_9RHOB|nr:site-2 protease family protein [Actibacterium atlanticum]KCV83547.1 SREBP protease [Actibacterium atlanticum]